MKTYVKLVCFLIVSIEALRPTNLCKLDEMKCSKTNTTITCEKPSCNLASMNQCNSEYCATSKNSCDSFKSWKEIISTRLKKSRYENKKIVRHFYIFETMISKCPSKEIFQFKANDICFNNLKCFNTSKVLKKQLKCPCVGKFSFGCGINYCAYNKNTCYSMLIWMKYFGDHKVAWNHLEEIGIKSCSSPDIQIIYKGTSDYNK